MQVIFFTCPDKTSDAEKLLEIIRKYLLILLLGESQLEEAHELVLVAPHWEIRAEEAVLYAVPAHQSRGSFRSEEGKGAADVKSYVVQSRKPFFRLVPLLIAAEMGGKYLQLREIPMYICYAAGRRKIIPCVAAVYEQRQLSLHELVYAEGLGRVRIEFLEIRVELDAVEPQLLYLLYGSIKILISSVLQLLCQFNET